MSLSIPGVLVSRDGVVRRYIGHSNRGGTMLGTTLRDGSEWVGRCSCCKSEWRDKRQRDTVRSIRDHWSNADASMAATHDPR